MVSKLWGETKHCLSSSTATVTVICYREETATFSLPLQNLSGQNVLVSSISNQMYGLLVRSFCKALTEANSFKSFAFIPHTIKMLKRREWLMVILVYFYFAMQNLWYGGFPLNV